MKSLKKIIAIALVVMMTAAMTVTALAASGTYNQETAITSDVYENYNEATPPVKQAFTDFTVTSKVDKNEAAAGYGETAFQYTLAIGTAVPVSTDADGNKVAVYAGLDGAKLTDGTNNAALGSALTVSFPAAAADAEKTFKVDLSGVTSWPNAGVYRYTLTQTAMTAEQTTVGFQNEATNGKDAVVKYVDVYVADTAAAGATAATYAVVNAVIADKIPAKLEVGTNSLIDYASYVKTDRFVNTFGEPVKDPENPNKDQNTTNVIEVTKVVTGNMGDKNYQFPFDLTIYYTEPTTNDAATSLAGALFKVEVSGNAVANAPQDGWKIFASDAASTTYSGAITIPDGGKVTITVPNNVYVKVQETVEASLGYTVSTKVKEAAGQTLATEQLDTANKKTDETGIGGTIAYTTKDKTVQLEWTNNLEEISPTGVIMRIAPFASMFAAGIILIAIVRRRKDEVEA